MTSRLSSLALTALLACAALPAQAACGRFCDDESPQQGGSSPEDRAVAKSRRPRPPPVEMSLSGYVLAKLRDEAHEVVDRAAYRLAKAAAKVAVTMASERSAPSPGEGIDGGSRTATPPA